MDIIIPHWHEHEHEQYWHWQHWQHWLTLTHTNWMIYLMPYYGLDFHTHTHWHEHELNNIFNALLWVQFTHTLTQHEHNGLIMYCPYLTDTDIDNTDTGDTHDTRIYWI